MSFVMNSFKYGIFLVNFLFFILGSVLFYGSYSSLKDPLILADSIDKTFIYFSLIVSGTILLISFLGCCGTCYENSCMVKAYALLILFCIILQISVFIMISRINTDKLGDALKKEYIKKYDEDKPEIKEFIDALQSSNKCCGVDSFLDYEKKTIAELPKSCCELGKGDVCTDNNVYKKGCKATIQEMFGTSKKTFNIVLGITLGIQLLIVIASCALSKNIREQYIVV